MQQTRLLTKRLYHLTDIDCNNYLAVAKERKQKLDDYAALKAEGAEEKTILSAIKVSRSNYYRWKKDYRLLGIDGLVPESTRPHNVRIPDLSDDLVAKVLALRRKHPIFGKKKIRIFLKREYKISASESKVGRILRHLMQKNLVKPASFYTGKYEPKPRSFKNHAQRLPKGARSKLPGELVQIDHMTIKLDSGRTVKHFHAICPTTRYIVGQAYRSATSNNAADFLKQMLQELPFPVISIQVDGGSEFMGAFERAAKELDIPLYVLPPRMPKMNAYVERVNGTVKYEFYKLYDKSNSLELINHHLKHYNSFYNKVRPHSSLQGLTPVQYFSSLEAP